MFTIINLRGLFYSWFFKIYSYKIQLNIYYFFFFYKTIGILKFTKIITIKIFNNAIRLFSTMCSCYNISLMSFHGAVLFDSAAEFCGCVTYGLGTVEGYADPDVVLGLTLVRKSDSWYRHDFVLVLTPLHEWKCVDVCNKSSWSPLLFKSLNAWTVRTSCSKFFIFKII